MKTRSIFMISLAFVAMSCAKEVLPETNPEENVELKLVPMEFTTALETKAGITGIVDGIGTVEWAANDEITVFDNLGGKNTFTTAVGGASSVFTGKVTEGATAFYALYPERTSAAEFDAPAMTITSKLFPDQTAVVGSYAEGSGGAVMVASADADNRLSFKNMTSHIRFTLNVDEVVSITLMGNNAEKVAGVYTIDLSGSEPIIAVSKPETYVRLHNGGNVMAQGDYYFTILPVEFTEGFTVILSKKDGTQVARKTEKEIASLNQRNQILPMKAVTNYHSHMNYFVKYLDGFDITLGGYTFNKTTHTGGKLVNATYNNGNITKDGVYFIDPTYTEAKNNKAQAYSNLIVVGSDASQRTKFDFYRQARPYDGGTVILMANLDCTVGDKNAFAQNAEVGHSFAEFGDLTLYNCHFRNVGKNFFEFKNSAFTKINVYVEECEFGFNAPAVYLFNTGSNVSAAQSLTFRNNVFYAETGTTMTAFKMIHSDKFSISDLDVDKNTFSGTMIETNMLRLGDVVTTLNCSRNLFVGCSADAEIKVIALRVGTNKANVTGVITNNYYYSVGTADFGMGVGKSALTSMTTINSAAKLTSSPLSSKWNPADGAFGPYVFAESVSNTVGAYRSDMKATPATANYAAANYVSVDYGTL
ncbi:MAG: hypothetical protein E7123_07535 [Bacteroidales bacterium]|nr:hypothetical protein [Bacteroidales bacterium]